MVTGIYQAFFYRGLPRIDEKPPRPSWDYDYGCLLICDVSQKGEVGLAWKGLPRVVKNACWDGASIYVMVVRGSEAQPEP